MSLVIDLIQEGCPAESRSVHTANITHNLADLALTLRVYGVLWKPEEYGIVKAEQLIPYLENAISNLRNNEMSCKRYEAVNGWGTTDQFLEFLTDLTQSCYLYPKAIVKSSR